MALTNRLTSSRKMAKSIVKSSKRLDRKIPALKKIRKESADLARGMRNLGVI